MKTTSEIIGVKPDYFTLLLAREACRLLRNRAEEKEVIIKGKSVQFLSIEEKAPSMLDDGSKQIKAEVCFDDKYYDLNVTVTEFNNTAFSIISEYGLVERKNNEPF